MRAHRLRRRSAPIAVACFLATVATATATVAAAAAGEPSPARAMDIPCARVEPGVVRIDGMLDDWRDVERLDLGGSSTDLGFTLRCNYDERTIYLSIDVRDNYLVRSAQGGAGDDHVEIAFASGAPATAKVEKLLLFPADDAAHIARRVRWASGRQVHGIEVAESLQPAGWSVEAAIALTEVPGWAPGVPLLRMAVGVSDSDSKAHPAQRAFLSTAPMDSAASLGVVEFAEAKGALDALLRDRHLTGADVAFDQVGRLVAGKRARAIIAGRWLAILTDEYSYIELPLERRADLLDAKLVDLAGDGRDAVLVRYAERGQGGAREVLAAYRVTGDGLRRTFGVEVAKQVGERRLSTRVTLARRGKATDILVEALPAVGFTEATYHERRADDLVPIPLPWAKPPRARFQFKGDDYTQAE